MWLFKWLLVILCLINMSLHQIRDSYFYLTYFSFPLLFFIYFYLINDLIFFCFLFSLKRVFPWSSAPREKSRLPRLAHKAPVMQAICDPICDPIRDPIRDPVRHPVRDPIRDPVRDPIRDSVRSDPIQVLSTPCWTGRNIFLLWAQHKPDQSTC